MKIKKMLTPDEIAKRKLAEIRDKQVRKDRVFHLILGDLALELMRTNFTIGLRSVYDPQTTSRIGAILSSMESSGKRLRKVLEKFIAIDPSKAELMEGEHAYEVYRLMRNFGLKGTDYLRKMNDDFENQK